MDKYFDKDAACAQLTKIIAERGEQCPDYLQLSEYIKDDGVANDACIIEIDRPHCWRLATSPNEQGAQEELVLRLQGIMCDRNLPPIRNPQSISLHQCKYRRQSIMLTGFDAEQFQTCVKSIQAIFKIFEQTLPDSTMQEWSPTLFDGHVAIDMGNRFFTDRRNQANHEMVPFKHSVDPDGILERATGTDFVHLRENEVEYFKCIDNGSSGKTYKVIEPIMLNKGDILEAQVSFQVVPVKNNMFKPLVVLRAITLIDNHPNKDAILKKMQSQGSKQTTSLPTVLKRRVGYAQDEIEDSTKRQSKKVDMGDTHGKQ